MLVVRTSRSASPPNAPPCLPTQAVRLLPIPFASVSLSLDIPHLAAESPEERREKRK